MRVHCIFLKPHKYKLILRLPYDYHNLPIIHPWAMNFSGSSNRGGGLYSLKRFDISQNYLPFK